MSNDRLRRFISNYDCLTKKKSLENQRPPASNKNVTSDESTDSAKNEKIIHADDPDTETFESSEDENDNADVISITTEKYYAIIYDNGWYIGRILELREQNCTIKFLKAELDKFVWPKKDDIQLVPQKYIFYGPIPLIGCNPFEIKRSDKCSIIKLYKKLK